VLVATTFGYIIIESMKKKILRKEKKSSILKTLVE